MPDINDFDLLTTTKDGDIYIDLTCGFGQPSQTTIYLKDTDNTIKEIDTFTGNVSRRKIGSRKDLRGKIIEIHTTIDDVRDNPTEMEDISCSIVIHEAKNSVDTRFKRKTKGKGSRFNSFYVVSIF